MAYLKKQWINSFYMLLACLFLLGCEPTQQETTRFEKSFSLDSVVVKILISPLSPSVADRALFKIEWTLPFGSTPILPPLEKRLPAFHVYKKYSSPLRTTGKKQTATFFYELDPLAPGDIVIPALTFSWHHQEKIHSLTTKSFSITIQPAIAGEKSEIKGIKKNLEFPPEKYDYWVWGTLVSILLVVVFLLRKKKAQPAEVISPKEKALKELEQLKQSDLLRSGNTKQFYFQITQIIRLFLEAEYKVHAPKQTTEEFLTGITQQSNLPVAMMDDLKIFLRSADLVKYAAYQPSDEDIRNVFSEAQKIIEIDES